ncbi:DUF998 domain-containing protein [Acidianus manzaensis]|uniref:DUF998 domain-containing protein n=1 Tax=Acidianus manzaensis TaxID=282676 RepID=A0A1W6JZA4_9CREN|nr:DUF998 domain-containing protein [Acidianus manzaensis]ARM75524.1 hypothetical protein B6F84_05415 [Acidianus manzaensis]
MNKILIVGLIGILSAWITIIISALINPWFSITHNALSDLGGGGPLNGHPYPTDPLVYNGGLIITSLIILIFSILIVNNSRNKLEIVGGSFFMISALFLALIGIYHEGTYPHNFVSLWFFILASISYIVISISLILTRIFLKIGIILLSLIILGWILFIIIPWQSVAEDEIFGISIIDICVILHGISFNKIH